MFASAGPADRCSIAIRPKVSFVPATFPANFSSALPRTLELARSRRRSRKFRTAVVVGHDKPPSGRDDPAEQRNLPDEEPAHYLPPRSDVILRPGLPLLGCLLFGPLVCTQSAEVASKRKGTRHRSLPLCLSPLRTSAAFHKTTEHVLYWVVPDRGTIWQVLILPVKISLEKE